MTKEYKQIYVTVGEMTTMNFKKAIAEANKKNITRLVFSWSVDARLSASEFQGRIVRVLQTLTDWGFTHKLIDNNKLEVTITPKQDS